MSFWANSKIKNRVGTPCNIFEFGPKNDIQDLGFGTYYKQCEMVCIKVGSLEDRLPQDKSGVTP